MVALMLGATDWPGGKPVLEVLVRSRYVVLPEGAVLEAAAELEDGRECVVGGVPGVGDDAAAGFVRVGPVGVCKEDGVEDGFLLNEFGFVDAGTVGLDFDVESIMEGAVDGVLEGEFEGVFGLIECDGGEADVVALGGDVGGHGAVDGVGGGRGIGLSGGDGHVGGTWSGSGAGHGGGDDGGVRGGGPCRIDAGVFADALCDGEGLGGAGAIRTLEHGPGDEGVAVARGTGVGSGAVDGGAASGDGGRGGNGCHEECVGETGRGLAARALGVSHEKNPQRWQSRSLTEGRIIGHE